MTDLLAIVKAWPDAEGDERRRHEIREAVIRFLQDEKETKPDGHDRQARFDAAIAAASAASSEETARECLKDILLPTPAETPLPFRPSNDWRGETPPAAVIWRDHDTFADAVVSVGEVAVLAGAGKGGKSYLCVALAKAAAEAKNDDYGKTCGLRIAARPVVILSYEDAPKRIDMRVQAMDAPPGAVLLAQDPAPLYGMDRQTRTWEASPAWRPTWDGIAACQPGLVVIDTGPKAMRGETLDPAAIIAFLQDVEREAKTGNFGVLITAHDTKAARDSVRRGDTLDAGIIAGSAQWHDSPRGVLHLTKEGPGDSPRILEAVKCSYGRDGWGARLDVSYNNSGAYAGLELKVCLDDAGIAEARENLKSATSPKQPKTTPAVKASANGGNPYAPR